MVCQVDSCRKILAELIMMEAQIKAQAEAFKRVSQGYEAGLDTTTDFSARLEQSSAEIPVKCGLHLLCSQKHSHDRGPSLLSS